MVSHWFLGEEHTKFRNSITSIIDTASKDLCRPDARTTLGDEHDQCQYLFTKIYTLMQERQDELSSHLLCCSKLPDPVVEIRYYRSRVRRSKTKSNPQFVEGETGADFALALFVDFPSLLCAQRSVLGQAKIIDQLDLAINQKQLKQILSVAGPESATYLIWGENFLPIVVSAENVNAFIRTRRNNSLDTELLTLGKPLSEFFCDAFLGLWFGKDFDPIKEGENPPVTSIPILYHFLHRSLPPPNVVYFGLTSSKTLDVQPGVYVIEVTDI